MKNIILTLATVFSFSANACLGEAQIIAGIMDFKKSMSSCKVFINPNQVRFFAENQACPIDIATIVGEGIEVGLMSGHDCALSIGDELNGVVVKNAAGVLVLE